MPPNEILTLWWEFLLDNKVFTFENKSLDKTETKEKFSKPSFFFKFLSSCSLEIDITQGGFR